MTIRKFLSKIRWDLRAMNEVELRYVHRTQVNGETRQELNVIGGQTLLEIEKGGLRFVRDDGAIGDGDDLESTTFVPYARIREVHLSGTLVFDGSFLGGWEKVVHELKLKQRHLENTAEQTGVRVIPQDILLGGESELVALKRPCVLLRRESDGTIVIDGSAGEGGGQILRSSLTLSMLTRTPVRVENVRAGRKKPGLMRQHLTCVLAAKAICGAEVRGASVGSTSFEFRPGELESVLSSQDRFQFDVGTAGAVCLVAQTIAIPIALRCQSEIEVVITGGTHTRWAPTVEFLEDSWVPLMNRMGLDFVARNQKHGFYPAGGGKLSLRFFPSEMQRPLTLEGTTSTLDVQGHAVVANLPLRIAKGQLTMLGDRVRRLAKFPRTVESRGPGNACWLRVAQSDTDGFALVFAQIGEQNRSSKDVVQGVHTAYEKWAQSGAATEEHLADQLVIPLALLGGAFSTSSISEHTRTNIAVVEAFTTARFGVEKREKQWVVRAQESS